MILLDTCSFLWLVSDQNQLSEKAKTAIESSKESLFISSISAFEIALKCRSKKIRLPLPVKAWFDGAINFHGVREVPITSEIAIASVLLPPLHNDPCDRIIIATAMVNKMYILSPDRLLAKYERPRVVW